MFHVALLFAHLAGPTATKTWYGPATASFETQFAGNPYDPVTNDVRVRFTASDGKKIERSAYYVDGTWRSDLVAEIPGDYTPVLVRNGVELVDAPCVQSRILLENKLDRGFLHPDPGYPNRFRFDDGSPFVPVGHNLGWPIRGRPSTESQVGKMGESGLTWTRLLADERAGRNPWWPVDDPNALSKELWPPALNSIASVEHTCDLNSVSYQLVMFDHAAFSSAEASGWAKNPWNAANGGFLKAAADFFSDPESKRRTKMWLRYAVARYGSDPNLMAFELFDEVENTDAARQGRWTEIEAWTNEMAAYIRLLDSAYDHMITISSSLEHPELWKSLDYYQPHMSGDDLAGALVSAALPHDRPLFFGAFTKTAGLNRASLRDALYTGLLANCGAPPMARDWDQIDAHALYPELATAAMVVKDSDIGHHPVASRLSLSVVGCTARGIGSSDWVLLRVIATGSTPYQVKVGGISISEGACLVEVIDLDTGKSTRSNVTVSGARVVVELPARDCVVIVRPV